MNALLKTVLIGIQSLSRLFAQRGIDRSIFRKKSLYIGIAVLSIAAAGLSRAQLTPDILGYWEGGLIQGDSLQVLKLEFTPGPRGIMGTASIPDWEFKPWVFLVRQEGNQVILRFLYGESRLTHA